MSTVTLLQSLFRYQAWANEELLEKIEKIDPHLRATERHLAIKLLSHSCVIGQIFSAHLIGEKHRFSTDNTDELSTLVALRDAVEACDRWYENYLETVAPDQLAEPISFAFTDGDRGCMTREEMMVHVITHSGYHRGEAGRVLAQLSISPPWDTFAVYLHQSEPSRREAVRTNEIA